MSVSRYLQYVYTYPYARNYFVSRIRTVKYCLNEIFTDPNQLLCKCIPVIVFCTHYAKLNFIFNALNKYIFSVIQKFSLT